MVQKQYSTSAYGNRRCDMYIKKESRKTFGTLLCDRSGARTQGPYIKSVLLYQLS